MYDNICRQDMLVTKHLVLSFQASLAVLVTLLTWKQEGMSAFCQLPSSQLSELTVLLSILYCSLVCLVHAALGWSAQKKQSVCALLQ